ncbi:MAG: hypothetical protein AAF411_14350 [Myxococcota bacterium]
MRAVASLGAIWLFLGLIGWLGGAEPDAPPRRSSAADFSGGHDRDPPATRSAAAYADPEPSDMQPPSMQPRVRSAAAYADPESPSMQRPSMQPRVRSAADYADPELAPPRYRSAADYADRSASAPTPAEPSPQPSGARSDEAP